MIFVLNVMNCHLILLIRFTSDSYGNWLVLVLSSRLREEKREGTIQFLSFQGGKGK